MTIIIIFLHGLGRLNCSGIDALPSFLGASTISSSSKFVVEVMFWESGVVRSLKMVDPEYFVFLGRITNSSSKPPFLEDQFFSLSLASLVHNYIVNYT